MKLLRKQISLSQTKMIAVAVRWRKMYEALWEKVLPFQVGEAA